MVVVWLASFSDHKRQKNQQQQTKYAWVNAEAQATPGIHKAVSQFEQKNDLSPGSVCESLCSAGHEVVGIALIEAQAQHHALLPLSTDMKAQYNFWSALENDTLQGGLYYFNVLKADMLRLPVSLHKTQTGRTTCFFPVVPEFASRMFCKDVLGNTERDLSSWLLLNDGKIPDIVLRVPKCIAFLLAAKEWSCVAVPNMLSEVRISAGWESRHSRSCERLLVLRDDFSKLPPGQQFLPNIFKQGEDRSKQPLDNLQLAAALFQGSSLTESARADVLSSLYSASLSLQVKDLNERLFRQKNCNLLRARKYGAIRLLEFFWVAGMLQNDKNLRETLKAACAASLPGEIKEAAVAFIEGTDEEDACRLRVPSPATLSRCRARLDVAWTLLFRGWLTSHLVQCGGQGIAVYVQTDATWQARQEYQVTVLNCVPVAAHIDMHKDPFAAVLCRVYVRLYVGQPSQLSTPVVLQFCLLESCAMR